jgi:hypothetical protein
MGQLRGYRETVRQQQGDSQMTAVPVTLGLGRSVYSAGRGRSLGRGQAPPWGTRGGAVVRSIQPVADGLGDSPGAS